MEKGILQVTVSKKGNHVVQVLFSETGENMPAPQFVYPDMSSLNNKEVDVYRVSGQIEKIKMNYVVLYEKKAPKPKIYGAAQRNNTTGAYGGGGMRKPAYSPVSGKQYNNKNSGKGWSGKSATVEYSTAPYNFIPLNERVVEAEEVPGTEEFPFNTYHVGRHTGYIDLEIELLTPMYIRDTVDGNSRDNTCFDFFSPAGVCRIPGSSLRGMTRAMVEIMAHGRFLFFDDRRLYYRDVAGRSSLHGEYQKNMSTPDANSGKKSIYTMSAGVLIKKGVEYYILPSGFSTVKKDEARENVRSTGEKYKNFSYYKLDGYYLVVSGDMQKKNHDFKIAFPKPGAEMLTISEEDVRNYIDDRARGKKVPNLVELSKKGEVPCFYVQSGNRISFGHTPFFRKAYDKTIGDHIPDDLKRTSLPDIAEAVFGNETYFAGRVFFEDALVSGGGDVMMPVKVSRTLLGPNPTSFQHYLEQYSENLHDFPKNLAHYNTRNPIRGNKLYWHRSPEWEKVDQNDCNEKIDTKMRPVKKGTRFSGRVRFENLSDVELGALLQALELPGGCCHKLGMGKPLGLGSVRINPLLHISDRKKRYRSFSAEWQEGVPASETGPFKNAFELYVLGKIAPGEKSLWNTERMSLLKKMLDYENKPDNTKTEYMPLGDGREWRKRKVLVRPDSV